MVGFNLADILSQATKVKGEIQRIQEQAAKKTVEVTAGGGMIKVIVNGRQEILSIEIDPEVLKMNDKVFLQDLIKAGVNQAMESSKSLVAEEMAKLTQGLGPLYAMLKGL